MACIPPYVLTPAPPTVGLMRADGLALLETGEIIYDLDELPKGCRVFASWDVVDELLRAGKGEAFYWDSEPVRWRHERRDDGPKGWILRHSDVVVFRLPFPSSDAKALEGLVGWRDWLARYGAAPQGSLGSTGMSLLRATLVDELWTARGDLPPIRWTLGGRQQLGAVDPGTTLAGCVHLDLPAAYASALGELRYGGVWREVDPHLNLPALGATGAPVFAHAHVKVPGVRYGPLPRRGKHKPDKATPLDALIDDPQAQYPREGSIQGTWTWQELEQAGEAGCRVKVDRVWVHVTDSNELGQPFIPWWEAVQEGRAMESRFGALLCKASANSLWGQFAIGDGKRQLVRYSDGERIVVSIPPPGGGQPRSWDLAETITGRVRARLFELMRHALERLLSVHTDGGWVRAPFELAGWAQKEEARRLDLVSPQVLRYWRPDSSTPLHCVAGVPARWAPSVFDTVWKGLQLDA